MKIAGQISQGKLGNFSVPVWISHELLPLLFDIGLCQFTACIHFSKLDLRRHEGLYSFPRHAVSGQFVYEAFSDRCEPVCLGLVMLPLGVNKLL
ncbi:hypothetical protein [Pseudorhizobium endolithicum]|uniref:hypothetical protein n=1 Tax=Pseudorhizobium endolithicum TaxID=1191678 RepID=UPI00115B9F91|nr:hypothetical protein [Pseudorhizobium endolithicum]